MIFKIHIMIPRSQHHLAWLDSASRTIIGKSSQHLCEVDPLNATTPIYNWLQDTSPCPTSILQMVKAGRSPSKSQTMAADGVAGAKWQREGVQRVSSVIHYPPSRPPPTADHNISWSRPGYQAMKPSYAANINLIQCDGSRRIQSNRKIQKNLPVVSALDVVTSYYILTTLHSDTDAYSPFFFRTSFALCAIIFSNKKRQKNFHFVI